MQSCVWSFVSEIQQLTHMCIIFDDFHFHMTLIKLVYDICPLLLLIDAGENVLVPHETATH